MAELRDMPEIVRLDLATVELPDSHPAAELGRTIPVYGYCIRHPDGPILVDTGVGSGNEFIDEMYQPKRLALDELLARSGVDIGDVNVVVNSHLHFDHCGQNPLMFAQNTTFLSQAEELAAARADHYTDQSWALAPVDKQRSLVGDERIAEGVTVLATPGHTVGHQSVLVEAAGRRIVIGAQLVWHAEEFTNGVAAAANVDPEPELQRAAVESIERIKALRPEMVHFSHCEGLSLPSDATD